MHLISDLLEQIINAIEANDPAALFDATKTLGDRIGMPAAVAIAHALVDDTRGTPSPASTGVKGWPLASCA